MNLKTENLRNIFFNYILSQLATSCTVCPPVDHIISALRFPSKKTKKIMDHILECSKCLPLFIFLKDIVNAEQSLINSIDEITINKKRSTVKQTRFFNRRFLRLAPYGVVIALIILVMFTSIKYISLSEKTIVRSPKSEMHFTLVQAEISPEPCTFYLKWNEISRAKSYSIYIFDSSLVCLWNEMTNENRCLLPVEICEKIRHRQRLIIYFEAKEEEGKIIYNWLGELSFNQLLSNQKRTEKPSPLRIKPAQ